MGAFLLTVRSVGAVRKMSLVFREIFTRTGIEPICMSEVQLLEL